MATLLWIGYVKDGLQCLFLLVTGTLAVLTYLKARTTLLQPIRTEVFKEQLKVFSRILDEFEGGPSGGLHDAIDYRGLIELNLAALLSDYSKKFFGVEPHPFHSLRKHTNMGILITTPPQDLVEKYGSEAVWKWNHVKPSSPMRSAPSPPESPDPLLEQDWGSYWCCYVHIPKAYHECIRRLERLLDSPVLPSRGVELLRAYKETLHLIPRLLAAELSLLARDLPSIYPDREGFLKRDLHGFYARVARPLPDLEMQARPILEFARSYLDPDRLLD